MLRKEALEALRYALANDVAQNLAVLVDAAPSLDDDSHLALMQVKESLERMRLVLDDALSRETPAETGAGIAERIQVDKVLRTLAATTSSRDTDSFFKYCVRTLAELFGSRYSFIGLIRKDLWQARTLVVWAGGDFAENFEYDLLGTPCEDVLRFNKELIPNDAAALYPDDRMLADMGIESYFGAPLVSQEQGLMGLVSVMDTKPMELNEWVAPVLGVFASRIATELHRKSVIDDLERLNAELESRVAQRTEAFRAEVIDRKHIDAQRKWLTGMLEQRNDELQQFVYTVSHDLKSPLVTIFGFLGLLEKDLKSGDAERIRRDVEPIGAAARQMERMLGELVELSRIGQTHAEPSPVSLTEVAREAADLLAGQIGETNVKIGISPDLPEVSGVRPQLVHMMQNLIGNAVKFMGAEAQPVVEVDCRRDGRKVVFFVRDNGIGIDPRHQEKIFGLFERLDAETEGTGLGLAIVKRVIEVHGGRIWVESEEEKGSTFFFTLGET